MCKKLTYLASFVLVLSLVGNVRAATVVWTDAGPDHLWSTPENWSTGTVPTSADLARIKMIPGPTIANEGAVVYKLQVAQGGSSVGDLTVDGGTLTVANWFTVAQGVDSDAILNMNSGTITVDTGFNVAFQGSGTLNMTGGTITVAGQLYIAQKSVATGHANLDGGTITTNSFSMRGEAGSAGTMDISAGTLIINGDAVSTVQGYIDNGWITAYDGNGTLQLDYDMTNKGKTTLKAVHMLNPNPANGALVAPGEMELSWASPDPCVPGQTVPVDVYFTHDLQLLEQFTDPAAIQVVSKQNVTSVVVQTQPKTWYYWAVDTYIGDPNDPIFGPIFSLFADNQAPQVDAGADVVTWLADAVVRTKNLDATVTDDEAYTVQWIVVNEPDDPNNPDAVITDPSAEDTSITLSALGEYVLQLEAFDGEYTGSDTVTINVYNDGCEAAQSLPDYVPLVGDLNGDCRVDEADLALLEENWLQDNSLTEP
jgi:hypothetical protein